MAAKNNAMADSKKQFADLMVEAEIREANRRFAKRRYHRQISFVCAVVVGLAACVAQFASAPSLSRRILPILYLAFLIYHMMAGNTPRLFGLPDWFCIQWRSSSGSRSVRTARAILLFGPLFVILFAPILAILFGGFAR